MNSKITALLVVAVFLLPLASFAADLKKSIAKYAEVALRKDLKGLHEICALTQLTEKSIKASSPKFRVEKELTQYFEQEKGYLEYKVKFFTPTTKWKILETKKTKLQLYNSKPANAHIVYVETRYPNINDAPLMDVNGDVFLKKPLKRSILIFTIDDSSGLYYKVDHAREEDEFWETPVRVSNLTYSYSYRSLDLQYTADGGRQGTTGGKPPYSNKISIEGKTLKDFLGPEADAPWMSELSDGQHIEIRSFKWPEGTRFPVKLRVDVTDSSTPPKTASAEITIPNGNHVERGPWSP